MRQHFKYLNDINDPIFFYVEVDKHIITVKAFVGIFLEGLPENTSNLNIIEDIELLYDTFLKRHNTILNNEQMLDVISGNVFNLSSTENAWFKYYGCSQILRGYQNNVEFINLNTSTFDRSYGKNISYDTQYFKEWTDCAMWSFDFNFEGMNWFYPKNLFYETINNKADFNRSEYYQSSIKTPNKFNTLDDNPLFSTGENRKRILSMFLFDKDDYFTSASFYSKVNHDFGILMDIEGEHVKQNEWIFTYPLINNYKEDLPIPKIKIDMYSYEDNVKVFRENVLYPNELATFNVVLYDDEFYISSENDNTRIQYDLFDNLIVLEYDTIDDFYDYAWTRPRVSNKYIIQKNLKIYIESDSGYLNKNAIELKNGVGKFNFRALDLKDGDEVTIKLGYKTLSNVSEIKIKIKDFVDQPL